MWRRRRPASNACFEMSGHFSNSVHGSRIGRTVLGALEGKASGGRDSFLPRLPQLSQSDMFYLILLFNLH